MIEKYITNVTVRYFNVFQITWCVTFTDGGDVIAEICREIKQYNNLFNLHSQFLS
jgi:hypothetical protein